jgi:lipopolysaccharide biosynthesis glycosyltransferase
MIHVSCAVEGDYVPHCAAMLHSVIEHSGGTGVHVHYLHGPDLAPEAARSLERMLDDLGAAISFHYVPDERVEGLPTKGFTGKATWYRIFLPELLPHVDRVLYLDADLIALDSLVPLWETDLGTAYVGAVTNVFQHNHVHRPASLGLSGPEAYFNAGVLLMNLELLRRDRQADALLTYATTHVDQIEWRDQDTLNVVLGHRRLPLHPRWNCMTAVLDFPQSAEVFGRDAVEEARARPAIRHFEGPADNKPWHYLCDRALRDLYFEHRRHTPWPEVTLEGRTARNVIKRRIGRVRA